MKVVTAKLPEYLIRAIDELVEKGMFHSRSDVIRTAVRMLVDKYTRPDSVPRCRSRSARVVVVARR